jgi:hypothetical protein
MVHDNVTIVNLFLYVMISNINVFHVGIVLCLLSAMAPTLSPYNCAGFGCGKPTSDIAKYIHRICCAHVSAIYSASIVDSATVD